MSPTLNLLFGGNPWLMIADAAVPMVAGKGAEAEVKYANFALVSHRDASTYSAVVKRCVSAREGRCLNGVSPGRRNMFIAEEAGRDTGMHCPA